MTSGQMPVKLLVERRHVPHMVSIRISTDAASEDAVIMQPPYAEVSLTMKHIKVPHE